MLLFLGTAAFAVFNEKDLSHTLSVLRFELSQENAKMEASRSRIFRKNDSQHTSLVHMVKKCNELALILYSQNQDYTFDVTYSLKEVTRQYEEFNRERFPFDDIVARMDIEIDRYERLIESLRRLPPVLEEISEVPDSISISKDSLLLMFSRGKEGRGPSSAVSPDSPDDGGQPGRDAGAHRGARTFLLDEQGREDRDSCLAYARNLLRMYTSAREKIIEDNEHYTETSERLKETYDYAQNRYKLLQKRIFVDGQDNYFSVLKHLPAYARQAFSEAKAKYRPSSDGFGHDRSEWRGPVVTGFIIYVLVYLTIAILLSNLVVSLISRRSERLKAKGNRARRRVLTALCGVVFFAVSIMLAGIFVKQNFFVEANGLLLVFVWLVVAILGSLLVHLGADQVQAGMRLYLPVISLGLIVITLRIIFIPNRLVNLIFPPVLLLFLIWQARAVSRYGKKVKHSDRYYSWITVVVMGSTFAASLAGYVLVSIQVLIWWLFQLAFIQTFTAVYDLLSIYKKDRLRKKVDRFRQSDVVPSTGKEGDFIPVTWLYDLIRKAVVPVCLILSIPLCIFLAARVFDLTSVCRTLFYKPFFDYSDAAGNEILHLSLYNIVISAALFFVFSYFAYLSKACYRRMKFQKVMRESGQTVIQTNQVNLTLANNIIAICLWGIYCITIIVLFKIPMGAISIVAAGLATGVGLALKDVLNNFIYGIQLMSGRVRVGDFIECDGVRGKVDSITYQSTQVETLEGAIMSITNTSLFNKNFKNLTRNSPYEFVKITVGVNYGADIHKVKDIIREAVRTADSRDKFGRHVVEQSYGVNVVFGEFGDSSIDIAVKQFVIVEEEAAYIARAKEAIYEALNAAGVEIPFPQRDVHIRKD